MNTPICDKEAWDCSDWDSGLPPELVVNLEVARKLETNLRHALELLEIEAENLDYEGYIASAAKLRERIKELEEVQ